MIICAISVPNWYEVERTGQPAKRETIMDHEPTIRRGVASAAILDILILIAVSALAYFAESWARNNGIITLGEDSRGVFTVLAGTATALGLLFARGGKLRDIGFKRPGRWWKVLLWAVGILGAWVAMQAVAPVLVSHFVKLPPPDFSRYNTVAGNLRAALFMALALPFTASIPEEIIYRGFLMDRLTKIFGAGVGGAAMTVLLQSVCFGSVHFAWGPGGMIVTTMMGAVWGTAFLLCGRNLWIMIIAHTFGHLALVVGLYFSHPA
jgi:membrane protease YdiL (CAAX protease family)